VTTILNRIPTDTTEPPHRAEPAHSSPDGRHSSDVATQQEAVAIVGMGYVGLPTALSMLDSGTPVIGVDISRDRLSAIERFDVDLLDQDLDRLHRHLHTDAFVLSSDASVIQDARTVIVCVPTPISDHFNPDLAALSSACRDVVGNAQRGQTIILTSTTYIGCTRDMIIKPLEERGLVVGRDIHVAYAPERVDPGVAGHVIEDTPRVVGGATEACTDAAIDSLSHACPALRAVSSPEAAELTKLLENSFRAVNIALANEVSDVAGHFGLSPIEIVDAAATKPYGFMPFYPGPGVGGHCIPCDPHYLLWQLRAERMTSPVIDAAMTDIAQRPKKVVTRIREMLADAGISIHDARVHVVGVAYKPGVADLRESPALEVLHELSQAGVRTSYTDQHIPTVTIDDHELTSQVPDAQDVDLVLIHTHHPDSNLSWVNEHALVLDATYRLEEVAHREMV
jgi:nucleotide sugar dehydrogenase